jgi:hypothetical protein
MPRKSGSRFSRGRTIRQGSKDKGLWLTCRAAEVRKAPVRRAYRHSRKVPVWVAVLQAAPALAEVEVGQAPLQAVG